jgi:hypothetical protein
MDDGASARANVVKKESRATEERAFRSGIQPAGEKQIAWLGMQSNGM